jgi:hypothetical protein
MMYYKSTKILGGTINITDIVSKSIESATAISLAAINEADTFWDKIYWESIFLALLTGIPLIGVLLTGVITQFDHNE